MATYPWFISITFLLRSSIYGGSPEHCAAQELTARNTEAEEFSLTEILVPSLFPNFPPYIKFLSPEDRPAHLPPALRQALTWRGRPVPREHLVRNIVENTGFKWMGLGYKGNWTGYWGPGAGLTELREGALPSQKWNHFFRSGELSNKDLMWLNFRRVFRRDPLRNIPLTFNLPAQLREFKGAFAKTRNKLWIEKAALGTRGRGMRIVQDWAQINATSEERRVVQKYIHNSYRVRGKKSEMRIHALVTSYQPLRLYIYRDVSLVIGYENFAYGEGHPCRLAPSKCGERVWNLAKFAQYRKAKNLTVNMTRFWAQVDDITIKVVLAAAQKIAESSRELFCSSYNAYELLGMDFALDDQFIPYLLEVNTDPSMDTSSDEQEAVRMSHNYRAGLTAEGLTVAGHHLPPYLDPQTKDYIKKEMNLDVDPTFPEELYKIGESSESVSTKRKTSKSPNLKNEDPTTVLSPADLRHLIIAEDELSRTNKYDRIFPSETSWTYLKHLPKGGGHFNRLYADWERLYGRNRAVGIERLIRESRNMLP